MLSDSRLSSEAVQAMPVFLLVAHPCAVGVAESLPPGGRSAYDPGLVTVQGLAIATGSGMAHSGEG